MKDFPSTSVPVAHTGAGGASGVHQRDPRCLTAVWGALVKGIFMSKRKILSSQAKIKSIHTSGKINEVPTLEAVSAAGAVGRSCITVQALQHAGEEKCCFTAQPRVSPLASHPFYWSSV